MLIHLFTVQGEVTKLLWTTCIQLFLMQIYKPRSFCCNFKQTFDMCTVKKTFFFTFWDKWFLQCQNNFIKVHTLKDWSKEIQTRCTNLVTVWVTRAKILKIAQMLLQLQRISLMLNFTDLISSYKVFHVFPQSSLFLFTSDTLAVSTFIRGYMTTSATDSLWVITLRIFKMYWIFFV